MARPPPTPPDPAHLGAFELTGELLGRGGFADVWGARHRSTGWQVAIKQPRAEAIAMLGASMSMEARALARLQHPGVVRILDLLDHDCIVMERAQATVADRPPERWADLRALLLATLDALADVHSHGLIHRDIKPSNLLLGVRREPREPLVQPTDGFRLADFGVAVEELQPTQWPMAGSPAFLAPEQRAGRWTAFGPWTDLYALGRVAQVLGAPLDPTPPGLEPWARWLTAERLPDRCDRAVEAALGLLALGEPTQPAAPAPVPSLPQGSTLVHLTPIVQTPTEHRPEPSRSGGTRRLPRDWRLHTTWWPALALLDAGQGLQHLRQPRIVGQEALRDRLWSALRETADLDCPRVIALEGPVGIGRRALARWLAARAHAVGAAEVERIDANHPWLTRGLPDRTLRAEPGGRVRLLIGLDLDAAAIIEQAMRGATGPVLAVMARGGTLGEAWTVPPLTAGEMRLLIRGALSVAPGLVEHLIERAAGVPGRALRWLTEWNRAGALIPTSDGYAHADGQRPIVYTHAADTGYAELYALLEAGDPEAAWETYEAAAPTYTSASYATAFDILDALGAGQDDPRRLRIEFVQEWQIHSESPGHWRRLQALARRARRVGAESLYDEVQIILAQLEFTRRGNLTGAHARIAEARARVVARDDHALLCRVHVDSARISSHLGRHEEALTFIDRGLKLVEVQDAPRRRPFALQIRAHVLNSLGRSAEAAQSCRDGLALLDDTQGGRRLTLLLTLAGCLAYGEGSERAVPVYEDAIALAHRRGAWEFEGVAHNNLGWLLLRLDRVEQAERHLRLAIDRYHNTDRGDAAARTGLAIALAWGGEPHAALVMLEAVEPEGTLHPKVTTCEVLLVRAWCAAALGDAAAWPETLGAYLAEDLALDALLYRVGQWAAEAARSEGWADRAQLLERWLSTARTTPG